MKDEKVETIDLPLPKEILEVAEKIAKERGMSIAQVMIEPTLLAVKDGFIEKHGKEAYEKMFKRMMDLNKDKSSMLCRRS